MLQEGAKPALTRSKAEERFVELVRMARLPEPEANVEVFGHEVDFVWRRERLVVEVDGFAYHSSRSRFELDREKDGELSAAGVQVVRVTWHQIVAEPEAMLVRLAQTLARKSPGEPAGRAWRAADGARKPAGGASKPAGGARKPAGRGREACRPEPGARQAAAGSSPAHGVTVKCREGGSPDPVGRPLTA
jgi:very-short-patch-repair endonuclease